MRFILSTCLISVAVAAMLKSEPLKCHLNPGDRVVMSGTFVGVRRLSGLALIIRSGSTITGRIEIFPRAQTVFLRSKTQQQTLPVMIRTATYNGGNDVRIEITVNAARDYQVSINGQDYGTIPFIGGPAPTLVATNHDINTNQLQVFSACALNPAPIPPPTTPPAPTPPTTTPPATTTPTTTQPTTTLSPEVREATANLIKARTELARAITAQIAADNATAAVVAKFRDVSARAASQATTNTQVIEAIKMISAAARSAATTAQTAVAAATIAQTEATNADETTTEASKAAVAAARGAAVGSPLAMAKAAAGALAAQASRALVRALDDEMSAKTVRDRARVVATAAENALRFAENKVKAETTANTKVIEEAQQKTIQAAIASATAKSNVDIKTKAVEAAEVALAALTNG